MRYGLAHVLAALSFLAMAATVQNAIAQEPRIQQAHCQINVVVLSKARAAFLESMREAAKREGISKEEKNMFLPRDVHHIRFVGTDHYVVLTNGMEMLVFRIAVFNNSRAAGPKSACALAERLLEKSRSLPGVIFDE